MAPEPVIDRFLKIPFFLYKDTEWSYTCNAHPCCELWPTHVVPPVGVDWHGAILTAHVLKPQMGESVEGSMKSEPEPWIRRCFLRGCRAITKLVLLGVQGGVVLMAKVTALSHCQWGCRRGTRQVSRGCPPCVATKAWGAHGSKLGR